MLLDSPETERCVAECANFVIDRRLAVKDQWVREMGEVEVKNEAIWSQYLETYWK